MINRVYRFASVFRPTEVVYTLHSDSMELWDRAYRTDFALSSDFGKYSTLGDGMTQHGYENAVTLADAPDFFVSFAKFVRDGTFTQEERYIIERCRPPLPMAERVEFALSVKYKDGPKRYFNLSERRVSSRESLAYDKRWNEVKPHHDGTVDSAINVLATPEHGSSTRWALERWALREQIRTHNIRADGPYSATTVAWMYEHTSYPPGLTENDRGFIEQCYEAFTTAIEMISRQRWLDAQVDRIVERLAAMRTPATTKEETAVQTDAPVNS